MSMTDALADPLTVALALALTPPMIELYAVLWRVGVLEIRQTRARPSSTVAALLSA
jgi:hypothetical protein